MFGKKVDSKTLVPIIADGMIGHPGIQSGRLIPVIVIDCAQHLAIEAAIHAHKDTPPGDVVSTWGWNRLSKQYVYLTLNFQQPVVTLGTIPFLVSKQGVLVESIINARAVYLQPLTSGARPSMGLDKPKIIVEVPASASFPIWGDLYSRELEKQFRTKGLSKVQAKLAAQDQLKFIRDIQFRKRTPPPTKSEA